MSEKVVTGKNYKEGARVKINIGHPDLSRSADRIKQGIDNIGTLIRKDGTSVSEVKWDINNGVNSRTYYNYELIYVETTVEEVLEQLTQLENKLTK